MGKEQDHPEELKTVQGIKDYRFETPVIAINLTTDNLSDKYREYLQQGGDTISEE